MAGSGGALDPDGREWQPGAAALVGWARAVSRARGAVALAGGHDGAWRPCSAVGGGGYPAQLREKSLLRCYARQIFRSLRIWTDERRVVASLGAVVASTDDWTGKDDADLFPEDGSVVRG
ncbi:Serine/threonine-protein kinase HT1 [Hordeum vulgare]|nr:Serine/threonine-protein kinase HT1 [Hordeum vulgare]